MILNKKVFLIVILLLALTLSAVFGTPISLIL